jgi:hypothetical protein
VPVQGPPGLLIKASVTGRPRNCQRGTPWGHGPVTVTAGGGWVAESLPRMDPAARARCRPISPGFLKGPAAVRLIEVATLTGCRRGTRAALSSRVPASGLAIHHDQQPTGWQSRLGCYYQQSRPAFGLNSHDDLHITSRDGAVSGRKVHTKTDGRAYCRLCFIAASHSGGVHCMRSLLSFDGKSSPNFRLRH